MQVFFKLTAAAIAALFASLTFAAVEVNKADQASLEAVRGIGPALSGKLLAERQKSSFKGWADLIERVPGVGAGSAARLSAAGLTVDGKVFDGAVAAKIEPTESTKSAKAAKAANTAKATKAVNGTHAAGTGKAANPATANR
jgi:competence protein ComEA